MTIPSSSTLVSVIHETSVAQQSARPVVATGFSSWPNARYTVRVGSRRRERDARRLQDAEHGALVRRSIPGPRCGHRDAPENGGSIQSRSLRSPVHVEMRHHKIGCVHARYRASCREAVVR